VSSTSVPPTPSRSGLGRVGDPFALSATAIGIAWLAFAAAHVDSWTAWPLGILASAIGITAFERGRRIARRRQVALRQAVAVTAARNRELDLLRSLAGTLLSLRSTDDLFDEVARIARLLLRAEGGAVVLRSDVSTFLRVVAGDGLLRSARGRLLPVVGSLSGAAVNDAVPVISDDMAADSRNHHVEGLPPELRSAIVVPLRSRGEIIGTIGAYNRSDGSPFLPEDVGPLQTLADQVAVGLDRAALLDDARRSERALAEKNRALEEATALKSQFLANMSHEFRTPLNAIIGFSDLMLASSDDLSETDRDYLESIARNGRHLLGMINSVLDVSKLEAGRMTLHLARFDLRDAIRTAVADTESLRAVKHQRCMLDLGSEPVEINADRQVVRQVLFNLLSNASKFTAEGGSMAVSAVRTWVPLPVPADRSGDVPHLELRDAAWVAVRDNGIGIRKGDLDKLFKAFSQVDATSSRRQQGTGLGLALAKALVELHGGTVGVESVTGEGSTFWFILPVDGPLRQPAWEA